MEAAGFGPPRRLSSEGGRDRIDGFDELIDERLGHEPGQPAGHEPETAQVQPGIPGIGRVCTDSAVTATVGPSMAVSRKSSV